MGELYYLYRSYMDYGMTHLSPKQLQSLMDNKAKKEKASLFLAEEIWLAYFLSNNGVKEEIKP